MLDSGITVRVHGVEAAKDPKSGAMYFDAVSALRAYYTQAAQKAGFRELRDAAMLSMLAAPIGGMEVPWVLRRYSLNKMLFYQWKRAEAEGLGDAFPHDTFEAERKGPVPTNIDADLDRLEHAGLITVKRHDPASAKHQPWIIELTPTGRESARRFFDLAETWFRRTTITTKKEILPLDPAKLRARVHSEYREFRRKYVEVDDT
jgi:DNA-binding PadR family transcriptional regulator